jgi:hypothetical protein
MGVKYVKDFAFPKSGGFHGSNVQRYAKGGAVKKAHAKKEVPSFLKGKMMKKADGGSVSEPNDLPFDRSKYNNWWEDPRYIPKAAPPVPLAGPPTIEEFDRAARTLAGSGTNSSTAPPPRIITDIAPPSISEEYDAYKAPRTAEFRDANRNGIDDRDELMQAKRMNERIRAGMKAPRMNRRGMAMIAPEDERMMGRTAPKRMKAPRVPMRPYMPELNLDPEDIREYSRGRTFSPEAMYAKGGKVTSKKGQAKVGKVMREFKEGKLHSGSKKGPKVTNPKQAMAIALSEARRMKKAEGGEVKKAKKEEGKKKPKMKMEDLALKKMRHAEKYAPGLDLDNIHSYELSQEAKKEKKVEKYAKGGKVHSDVKMDKAMVRKAVHKHESEKHPGESRTKLRRGGVPVHSGKPMYGGGK